MTLHVVGVRQADGSLAARSIQIKDDAGGGAVEIEGSAGGVKGSCPSLTFVVNGSSVATSGATAFKGFVCTDLKSGSKVLVNGARQANSTILASEVTKR
jgi:hypothetical protein